MKAVTPQERESLNALVAEVEYQTKSLRREVSHDHLDPDYVSEKCIIIVQSLDSLRQAITHLKPPYKVSNQVP